MKKLLILAMLITMVTALNGQYVPQVSHFMYDHLRTNPGSAGSNDMICATGIYRTQYMDFGSGAPQSYFLEVDAPFNLLGGQHGIGVTVYNDKIGFNEDICPALTYALRISMGDGTLGIGIQAGVIQSKITPNWIKPEENDETDEYIPNGSADGMPLNLAAGLFYRNEDIYFGASVVNLNTPQISAQGQNNSTAKYNLSRQYYVTAGYSMQLANPVYEIKPAVLLKSDLVATDMDINLTLVYNKKIWGGVSYRTGEAVIGLIGLELIENLKVGLSYDIATSALTKESSGTFEVMLNYSFKIGVKKAPQKYKSIRFL